MLRPRFAIPGLGWLPFRAFDPTEVAAEITGSRFGVIGLSFVPGEGLFTENPVLEKSVILDFKIGCGFYLFRFPMSSDGFGRVAFFLELGLTLISGRKDYPVFSSLYTFYVF